MVAKTRMLMYLVVLLWTGSVAAAQTGGRHHARVHLQVSSSTRVGNDRMQALLIARGEDSDPARLADKINTAMQWALSQTRKYKVVHAQSRGYNIAPVYDKQVLTRWRGSQGLLLKSNDFGELAALLGKLQTRLQVQSVDFSVSRNKRQVAQNTLIGQALGAFAKRADLVRKDLGAGGYRIVQLDINTGERSPTPVTFMTARRLARSPALAPGTSPVTVTVSGVIQLTGR